MATTQDIIDQLGLGVTISSSDALEAMRAAVNAAWPHWRYREYKASAGTFANSTFEYSLSAYTDIEPEGIVEVWVHPEDVTTEPKMITRGYIQQQRSGTWYLIFDADTVRRHQGNAFDIVYERRAAAPAAVDDTVELDETLAREYMMYWYATKQISKGRSSNSSGDWAEIQQSALRNFETYLARRYVQPVARKMRRRRDRMM
jgi:hypothetical protein